MVRSPPSPPHRRSAPSPASAARRYWATALSNSTFSVVRHPTPPPGKSWHNATVTATGSQLSTIYDTGLTDHGLLAADCKSIEWLDNSTWYRPGTADPAGRVQSVGVAVGAPLGVVDRSFFGLTADSSSFMTTDGSASQPSARWTALGSKALRTMLAGLAPLPLRVGGTFTDFTVMPGPNPGVSKTAAGKPKQQQYNFSTVGWAAINSLVKSLPGSQLVVSVNGLLRHWDQPGIPWNPANAKAFIEANIASGYEIFGYELG